MGKIPPKLKKEIDADPSYKVCMLRAHVGHVCAGRMTREHAIQHAGRQLQEKWAIISACERGHAVGAFQDAGTMDKRLNQWVALNRATDHELIRISKAFDYLWYRALLNRKYGEYRAAPVRSTDIAYPWQTSSI